MRQENIFNLLYENYKITKPIRLIELFAGYGSQNLALKYLNANYESYKIVEWNYKSTEAYKRLHFVDDNKDYSKGLNKSDIETFLFNRGISGDWNKSLNMTSIRHLGERKQREIYNNIIATHNLVDIKSVKGEDLEIKDKDKFTYLLTYSFPCQDLSLAGKKKGMKDTSTRSGMLWEVERILKELKEDNTLPDVLLMENVSEVHGANNVEYFNKWQLSLENMGYKNYFQDLIATDYGIPQTRNRCFMVSILGDYNYVFPKTIPLKTKLSDFLEENVPEKYFLNDKMISYFMAENTKGFNRKERFLKNLENQDISQTITTRNGERPTDTYIVSNKCLEETFMKNDIGKIKDVAYIDGYNRKIRDDGLSNTITTGISKSNNSFLLIKNATKKGYQIANAYDGIDISPLMKYHRGNVQKEKAHTLTTSMQNGVTIPQNNNLRIRKLTPRECFRLMGVKDEDFDKISYMSDNLLYHLAGDSIVVNVLMAIFNQMLDNNAKSTLYNEDVLEAIKKVPNESVDLVVTDPPYHITGGGCSNGAKGNCGGILNCEYKKVEYEWKIGKDGRKRKFIKGTNHVALRGILDDTEATTYARQGKLFKFNEVKFSDWLPEIYRVLKPRTHCYIMINARNLKELQIEAEKVGFTFQQLLVWNKGNTTPNKYYMNACEFILMLRKGGAKNINNMGAKNIIDIPNIRNKKHPTEKPVELMKIFVENSSNEGDLVLDPFMGAGSTGLACKELNRNFIGIEIDEKYFNIAKERLK